MAISASSTAAAVRAAAKAALIPSLLLFAPVGESAPLRIASINLCTDQIALLLLPRDRILSLSFLADDPALSYAATLAAGIPKNRAHAEELLSLKPDLVLADRFANQAAASLLANAGVPLWFYTPAGNVREIVETYRDAGRTLGVPERAQALVEQMQARLAVVAAGNRATEPPSAAIFFPNAWAMGKGTLAHAALAAAGLRNAVPGEGYAAYSLEGLLALKPDLLVLPREDTPTFSQAAALLDHPAARTLWPASRRVNLPGNVLICGGPFFADAVERLAASAK